MAGDMITVNTTYVLMFEKSQLLHNYFLFNIRLHVNLQQGSFPSPEIRRPYSLVQTYRSAEKPATAILTAEPFFCTE